MSRKSVEILYFECCPNWEAAAGLVERTAREADVDVDVELIRVESDDEAVHCRFLGSPTIRVDGRDVEPGAGARTDYVLACRIYPGPEGPSGLPSPALIREALIGPSPAAQRKRP